MVVVNVKDLRIDKAAYPRAAVDEERVREFGRLLLQGEVFPAIKITRDHRLVDGIHRLLAALSIGKGTIEAEIIDTENLLLAAAESNSRHGLPLSSEEKRAVALKVLQADPKLPLDRIAKSLAVSRDTIERWTQGLRDGLKTTQIEKAKELRGQGRTQEEIAVELGVVHSTIHEWTVENPQVRQIDKETEDDDDVLPSDSGPLAGAESPEITQLKANLRPLKTILEAAKDARCLDHGNETIAFACGTPVEDALTKCAERLRLAVLEAKERKRT
jgi:DNA-binding transcriptional regulator YiaG